MAGRSVGSSRADYVGDQIRLRIQREKLRSGSRLGSKRDLREEYGVAPATVNEALKLLSARQLVEVKPGPSGGVFVADPSPLVRLGHKVLSLGSDAITASDCLVVREALEPVIIVDAARHASRRDVADLRHALSDLEASADVPVDYLRRNWQLHVRIAEITPNAILRNYYLGVMEFLRTQVADVLPDDPARGFAEGVAVHGALVDAIAAGDVTAVDGVVARHARLTGNPAGPHDN